MSDPNDSHKTSTISDDTKKSVSYILRTSAGLGESAIERVLSKIESGARIAGSLDLPNSPSATRDELRRLISAIDELDTAIIGVSHHANFAMWDATFDKVDDERLARFDGQTFGSELHNLRNSGELLRKAAQLAIDAIVVPRGGPPNVQARHFAFHVATALEDNGIEPNTTTDGTYFCILAELFSELMPTDAGGAYQRYGRWALAKDSVLEDAFVSLDRKR